MLTGRHGPKRDQDEPLDVVQTRNRTWWEATPMTYDWRRRVPSAWDASAWFDEQDRRFLANAAFYATDRDPFDRFLPYAALRGKQVLEIGVGSGLHAELLARAGAHMTGIDLTAAAISRTERRFALKGLAGRFFQWDAEQPLPEFDRAFDFVWSWGVIHHSSRSGVIVRNVHDWLRPDGTFAGMVYHRDSINAAVSVVRDWVLHGGIGRHSVDEALWRGTDGYMARFYSAETWRDFLLAFFASAKTRVTGQKLEVLPLPRGVREAVLPMVGDRRARHVLDRFGSFLTFEARGPNGL
ncbi:MAG: class I SAM-dependent methyltransferase [Chloroflexi bacterium]|nr:class I SAM-dependent methyltransferase [Chloroflexota bacterium]MBV9597392.1 class I SAM-dependent methyltransferase [Chloroflexota bacterium]